MRRSQVSRATLFRILAVLFAGAAAYHAVAFFDPAFSNGGAPWRHAFFCATDILCAWYILRRPRWFVLPFSLFTIQQLCSHGAHAWRLWRAEGRLDWLSFAVPIVVPCTLALLMRDALDQRPRQQA
jgi:hypothetical protein